MRRLTLSGLIMLGAALSGCASLVTPADPVAPLSLAFTAPVAQIEAGAERGDNDAEYALSFLMLHGLRGVEPDWARYNQLRQGAGTPTTLMITQYIPAVGGGAGRIHMIPVQQAGISDTMMVILDQCGMALMTGPGPIARKWCPEGVADRLAPVAAQLAAERAARTPLP